VLETEEQEYQVEKDKDTCKDLKSCPVIRVCKLKVCHQEFSDT
jgi:hypothetical protein